MNQYPTNPNTDIEKLNEDVKAKKEKPKSFDQILSQLNTSDILMLNEVKRMLKGVEKEELKQLKFKLTHLENKLNI